MEHTGARDVEDDDHDLLTFNESEARLQDEIAAVETTLHETTDEEARQQLSTRLEQLRGAQVRIRLNAEAGPGETGFLNYIPPSAS